MAEERKPLSEFIKTIEAGKCIRVDFAYLGRDPSRAGGVSKTISTRFLKVNPPATGETGAASVGKPKSVTFVSREQAAAACPKPDTYIIPLERFSGFHQAEVATIMGMVMGMQIMAPPPKAKAIVPVPAAVKEDAETVLKI